ncbi:uncharacterized protein LOC131630788 [Vicia villosa]|uniref:uncharacterized protein LOC131630788 n=1 Tax=Vicia villosa TaxID=3911 RepID=UPI00273CD7E4|nr:uncharacterized protein LOC131630788 [Vicia villosa]
MVHPDNIVADELEVLEEVNVDNGPKEPVNNVKTITVAVDLHGHPIACRLSREEKDVISELSTIKVSPRNILADLKRKNPESVSNIKQKEDNFTWALGICKSLLVDQKNLPSLSVTNRDNALMNTVATFFPTLIALLCRYHITCNVRSKLKVAVGTKERKDDNGNIIKAGVVVDKIMAVWREILDAHSEELYTEKVVQFLKKKKWLGDSKGDLCRGWDTVNQMLQNQHNEIQSSFDRSKTVVGHRFKGKNLYLQLIHNISRAGLSCVFHEVKRAETTGLDSSKCGCTIRKTYRLPRACILSKKMKLNSPIRMDEVIDHWKKLCFDDFEPTKEGESNITISDETIAKNCIFGDHRLENAISTVTTKGAPKKPKTTQDETSTKRDPSYIEHVDALIPDSLTPKSKGSANKGALDVGTEGNYGYRAVAGLLGKGEENHTLIRRALISELTLHRDIYGRLYEKQ